MPARRRRTRFAALAGAAPFAVACAAVLGIATCITRGQNPPPNDRGAVPDELLDDVAAGAGDAEETDALPIDSVVRFSIAGDDLAISSDFKIGDGQREVRLKGLDGMARVEVGQRPRGRGLLMPYFRLRHPADSIGPPETSVDVQGGRLTLTQRTTTPGDVQTTVTLVQDDPYRRRGGPGAGFFGRGDGFDPRPFAGNEAVRPDRVRLSVRVNRPAMPAADEVRVSAVSFAELLRRHPGASARYLGPLFRRFGQDAAVFRVDDRLAWQLFPGAADADEATASKVIALVDRLDDDDFRAREQATTDLELLGGPAVLILGELDRATMSAEQNTRLDAILSRHTPLTPEEAEALLNDAEFLLRCFTYSDVAPIRAAAAKALEAKLDKPLALDANAPPTARAAAADAVRDTLEPE